MTIRLTQQTQRLLKRHMKKQGKLNADQMVRLALRRMDETEGPLVEDLDPATQAAIGEGLAEAERGEGLPWEQVREELRARFILKK